MNLVFVEEGLGILSSCPTSWGERLESITEGARASTDAHHYTTHPKREKENFEKGTHPSSTTIVGLRLYPPPAEALHQWKGRLCRPPPSAAEGGRLRAFTTKSHTTGLVSGCVPSTPHHVPRYSTHHLRLRSPHTTVFVILNTKRAYKSNCTYISTTFVCIRTCDL
ncbi:unnamed protein product [Arctia plantaginis]|uniref:Uncharacterized protein n=1 Tax=Arctia plantaginis TaxID=874455 RepID=A0A8S1A7Y7_ARCPL|nr:unnamed protein product [Arctia plantaginis]CAB3243248.1 unnamed protein product [Arctia plantaginis]